MPRWLLLVLLPALASAAEVPILCLDPGGHTAAVRSVVFTPDSRALVSVGDDKSVRVWDGATGRMTRLLRGQVGPGHEGKLYAAALTRDGKLLAVGGVLAPGAPHHGDIRVLEFATGRITRVLRGHRSAVSCLAFAPDGRRLASGSTDQTIRVWNLAAPTTAAPAVLQGHQREVYGLAWSPDGARLASGSLDHTARIWAVPAGGVAASRQVLSGSTAEVRAVAWSPDGRTIATGSFDQIVRLYDAATGQLRQTLPDQGSQVNELAFSPDGQRLACGLGGLGKPPAVRLWSVASGRQARAYTAHTNTVMALAWSPDGRRIASVGGDNFEIHLWDPDSGATAHQLHSSGATPWAVAWSPDGTRLAYGQTSGGSGHVDPLERSFDLGALAPGADVAAGERWQRGLAQQHGRRLGVTPDQLGTVVREGDRELASWRQTTHQDFDVVRCGSFTPGGDVVVGSSFTLKLWSASGQLKRNFVGHTGTVWALAVSPDGRYLASAAGDQTLRVWSLQGTGAVAGPLLTLFCGTDREWVAWTPEGYYACSANAERLIGWQINRGFDRAADFYPAYQFRRQLHRPDVLRHLLAAGSAAEAVQLADAERDTPTDRGVTATNLPTFAPPTVTIVEPAAGAVVTTAQIAVRARLRDPNNLPIKSVQVLLNGRNENARGLRPKLTGADWTQTVTLRPGENQLALLAINAKGAESLPSPLTVTFRPPQAVAKPTLYVLAVGLSQYQSEGDSLKYAAKDARDYAAALQAQRGRLYDDVKVRVLTDAQATRGGILDALEDLGRDATSRDHLHVFLAGHGVQDNTSSYWLLPHDGDPDRLSRSAIRWTELQTVLQALPGRVFVALDTCHSAGASGTRGMRAQVYNDALRQMGQTEVGLITVASCQAGEVSLERDDWRNGAFTKALVAGLTGEADTNADGEVILAELEAFVLGRVKQLTEGRQHPTFLVPPTFDRALVVAAK